MFIFERTHTVAYWSDFLIRARGPIAALQSLDAEIDSVLILDDEPDKVQPWYFTPQALAVFAAVLMIVLNIIYL